LPGVGPVKFRIGFVRHELPVLVCDRRITCVSRPFALNPGAALQASELAIDGSPDGCA
jgi:hypothetical protein